MPWCGFWTIGKWAVSSMSRYPMFTIESISSIAADIRSTGTSKPIVIAPTPHS